jgi:hypothetical protein
MIIVGAPAFDCDGGAFCNNTAPRLGNVAARAAFGFVSIAGHYVEMFKLRPRPDELFDYLDFGSAILMSDKYVAVAANQPYGYIDEHPFGEVITYTRDGANVSARGNASGHIRATSLGLSNRLLLVGSPLNDPRCGNSESCTGDATLYDLSCFVQ